MRTWKRSGIVILIVPALLLFSCAMAEQKGRGPEAKEGEESGYSPAMSKESPGGTQMKEVRESSYSPVVIKESFEEIRKQDIAAKPSRMERHMKLLKERYDLSRNVTTDVTMSGGKPIPVGPTAKLKNGITWEKLAAMTPDEIKAKGLFPYLPLPHPVRNRPSGCSSWEESKSRPKVWAGSHPFSRNFAPSFPPPH